MKRSLLMVAGPTEIENDILELGAQPMVYNRTDEFSTFVKEIEKMLKLVFKTQNDVLFISSSGSGAMEAAVVNLLSEGDEALIVSGGTFGYRWFEIANRYNINCTLIELHEGEVVTAEMIRQKITKETKAVFVTANETSTGTLTDLESIGKYIKDTNAVLVVDAVSSLCADTLDSEAWHCDVVLSSSQKALALPPGLSFITLSQKAWGLVEESRIPKYYFDLKEYRNNLSRGQTPFTPAISLLYQLEKRLRKICDVGVDSVINNQKKKAEYLKNGILGLGLRIITQHQSNGVIGILFPPTIDANQIIDIMKKEHGIQITPSPGENKHRIARVGVYGDISIEDIDAFLQSMKNVLSNCLIEY